MAAREKQSGGLICDLPEDDSYVGFVSSAQAPPKDAPRGSTFAARVLDVQLVDGIVDLSAKQVRHLCSQL